MARAQLGMISAVAFAILLLGLTPIETKAQNIDAKAQAQAQALKIKAGFPADPKSTAKVDPMRGYYGNTYSCYWPDVFQCRHWWGADGSEVYFEARWTPEGVLTTKTIEGKYKVFYANGQWCAQNARAQAPSLPGEIREGDLGSGPAGEAVDSDNPRANRKINPLNNNDNDCAPIVDAVPGDHWVKHHQTEGSMQGMREQYVLLPGHQ